ncbi:hypothetical protein BH10PLA2_BH10PLA2_00900 [soil metagenome]
MSKPTLFDNAERDEVTALEETAKIALPAVIVATSDEPISFDQAAETSFAYAEAMRKAAQARRR